MKLAAFFISLLSTVSPETRTVLSLDSEEGTLTRDLQCIEHLLVIKMDEFPGDVGYYMECDRKEIWNVPRGSFQKGQDDFATVEDTACTSPTATCELFIYDSKSYADGLTSPMEGSPGYIAWLVDGETAAFYQADGPSTDYESLKFCSGPACPNNARLGFGRSTNGGVQECGLFLRMELTLDEFPTETGWKLDCNGKSVWNYPRGSFLGSRQFETIQSYACIDAHGNCCELTVKDSKHFKDGLTSPVEGKPGGFKLVAGAKMVVSYDGSAPGAEFEKLSFAFGSGCET